MEKVWNFFSKIHMNPVKNILLHILLQIFIVHSHLEAVCYCKWLRATGELFENAHGNVDNLAKNMIHMLFVLLH